MQEVPSIGLCRPPTGKTATRENNRIYSGPIKYCERGNKEAKAYVALYSCGLTRAVYLDLLQNQTIEEFLHSLKRFAGHCSKIFSDNGKTFVAAAKWLKKIMYNEKVKDWLAKHTLVWLINLSRAPWWSRQFEQLVGLMKQSPHKTIGHGYLRLKELEEVMLDIETLLNNCPLSYLEDDVQMPTLTPGTMLFGQPITPL
jgi:hypothetical protein